MTRRRPSYVRRVLRARLRSWLRTNWKTLAVLALMGVGLAFLESTLLSGYLLGFIHGVLLVAAPGAVFLFFLIHTGAVWQFAGSIGEDDTRDD